MKKLVLFMFSVLVLTIGMNSDIIDINLDTSLNESTSNLNRDFVETMKHESINQAESKISKGGLEDWAVVVIVLGCLIALCGVLFLINHYCFKSGSDYGSGISSGLIQSLS